MLCMTSAYRILLTARFRLPDRKVDAHLVRIVHVLSHPKLAIAAPQSKHMDS